VLPTPVVAPPLAHLLRLPQAPLPGHRPLARFAPRLGQQSTPENLIERVFESRQFENLRIPLAVVATDLTPANPGCSRRAISWMPSARVARFQACSNLSKLARDCLADGGLVAPVPTHAARELGASVVIGVSWACRTATARSDEYLSSRK